MSATCHQRNPLTRLSQQVVPAGLARERQCYLFTKIRKFCSEEKQDVTCPRPAEQTTNLTELQVDDDESASVDTPAQNQEQVLAHKTNDAANQRNYTFNTLCLTLDNRLCNLLDNDTRDLELINILDTALALWLDMCNQQCITYFVMGVEK